MKKFNLGDSVTANSKENTNIGTVVGFYSIKYVPEGYVVEYIHGVSFQCATLLRLVEKVPSIKVGDTVQVNSLECEVLHTIDGKLWIKTSNGIHDVVDMSDATRKVTVPFWDNSLSEGDKKHLTFIYKRMCLRHDEKDNVDYMLKFKEIIDGA